jgi:HAD superfamily hydrolase (TIGR01509 family)
MISHPMSRYTRCAVLFDMDGVLIDSYEAWFFLMNDAARHFGYPTLSREKFQEVWGQGPDLDVELFFTNHTVAQVETYYNHHFRDYAEHVRKNEHAAAAFARLDDTGMGIGVITNTPSPIAREVLAYVGIEPGVLVGGTDVPRGKPAPDMVFEALARLDVPIENAILIGDSDFDRGAASAAGITYVHYDIASGERLDRVVDGLPPLQVQD